jgi:ribosome-associated heat shock protein Hsp15
MPGEAPGYQGEAATQRLDKWLWYARVVKTRSLAARLVGDGKIRLNRIRMDKPGHTVKIGDVLTISLRGEVRVLRVLDCGRRRGPPAEAQTLFEDVLARSEDLDATQSADGQPPSNAASARRNRS